jgi:hypothetical protein
MQAVQAAKALMKLVKMKFWSSKLSLDDAHYRWFLPLFEGGVLSWAAESLSTTFLGVIV